MYESHFGFAEAPFGLTPNTHFFLNANSHQQALNLLHISLSQGEGFIKIVGEVGTGKTLLCRKLLQSLDAENDFVSAYIPNPYLTPEELRYAIADELGVVYEPGIPSHQLLKLITDKLLEFAAHIKKVVLVIDEAQSMPLETLEALRLMTNLETEREKLMQVVLFGQPELDEVLCGDKMRQLLQRISFSFRLKPLDRKESRKYLDHRVHAAGFAGESLFSDKAAGLLYRASGGVPRVLNILAHKSLLSAYGKGQRLVEKANVKAAVDDTQGINKLAWSHWLLSALLLVTVMPPGMLS